ncbi:enoyl-CoA hydratase/isomerase family protein [Prauserella flavalba]|uniref:enoyl-CoA hydratase/isomerase family protein n=1 Tax=Prauserella flavalba TaxID=1477506 RepID=UPI002482E4FD|nr:enoyl-CoA hydratase/isomerase family protein [Prauserella flavalba]
MWTLTLNDERRRNALDLVMRERLRDALATAMADDRCRSIVLTGAGGTFCAGGDLATMPTDRPESGRPRLAVIAEITRLLLCGAKPVVAAVEGFAYGAGLSLAAASDHVVAASDARLCCSFGKVGLIADTGLLWTLPQRVGIGRTKELLFFASVLNAHQAHGHGLVDAITEPGDTLAEAHRRAAILAAAAPGPIAETKRVLAAWPATLDEVLADEADTQVRLFGSADFAEGRPAFFDKRPARFLGH